MKKKFRAYTYVESLGLMDKTILKRNMHTGDVTLRVKVIGVSLLEPSILAGNVWVTTKDMLNEYELADGSPCGMEE